MGLLFYLAYIAVGIIQISAFIDGMHLYFGLGGMISFIIYLIGFSLPFGAIALSAMVFYGARYGWHWKIWQSIFLAAPGIVLSLAMGAAGGLASLLSTRRST